MGDATQQIGDNELRRRFEGQLSKFTNVVKGWQFRWFVLDPESGRLEYYLLEERNGRCRGSHYLAGALVLPSDEDSQTFSVNFASGEVYKVRATNPRERQIWVDRIRACAHFHNEALASNHPSITSRELMPPTPPGSRSHIAKNGQPSEELISLSLSAMDAFASVHDILHKVAGKHDELCEYIESLPVSNKNYPADKKPASELQASLKEHGEFTCLNENLLMLKSTSQSTLICLENALGILQDVREAEVNANSRPVIKSRSQVNETPTKYSSASISVPPSPKNKSLGDSGDGASPTPSVASFASYHHTPVRATKKRWSPRKKKGASASDLPAPGDYYHDGGQLQAPSAGGAAAKVASPKHKQQEKHTKGGRSYSPNVLKKFQAVKSGLSFVNHLKFNQE